jgi:MYXO-CTERM domain-containing protein
MAAPATFKKDLALPFMGGFDTGWVPSGSPLQVHLIAEIYASTHVDLGGQLVTSWPDALMLETPGTPGTGSLGIHYGVDVEADAKVTISIFGASYSWTGPIPYLPQFDYQVDASSPFDPWAFDGVSVDGSTMQATLAQISASDFIGISIPGLDGGFELDTKTDLKATYRTDQIVVAYTDGTIVEDGPIYSETGKTRSHGDAPLGGFIEYDVHPEGSIVYDGTQHLIPAFYISTIGPDFSIPIADIPIPFSIHQSGWVFDPVRVHVPLPDIAIEGHGVHVQSGETPVPVHLGKIAVGEESSKQLRVTDKGEAALSAMLSTTDPAFVLSDGVATISPGDDFDFLVTFHPTEAGEFSAEIQIASNDPDDPLTIIEVDGIATDDDADVEHADVKANPGGCGCEVAGGSDAPSIFGAFAIGAVALRRRRRRERA